MSKNCPHCGSPPHPVRYATAFACGSDTYGGQSDFCRMKLLEQERDRFAAALLEISKAPIGYGEADETFGNRTTCPECKAMIEIARRALEQRICPWCGGSGEKSVPQDPGSFPDGACSRCGGEGRLEPEQTT